MLVSKYLTSFFLFLQHHLSGKISHIPSTKAGYDSSNTAVILNSAKSSTAPTSIMMTKYGRPIGDSNPSLSKTLPPPPPQWGHGSGKAIERNWGISKKKPPQWGKIVLKIL